jgi:hypothetical protein
MAIDPQVLALIQAGIPAETAWQIVQQARQQNVAADQAGPFGPAGAAVGSFLTDLLHAGQSSPSQVTPGQQLLMNRMNGGLDQVATAPVGAMAQGVQNNIAQTQADVAAANAGQAPNAPGSPQSPMPQGDVAGTPPSGSDQAGQPPATQAPAGQSNPPSRDNASSDYPGRKTAQTDATKGADQTTAGNSGSSAYPTDNSQLSNQKFYEFGQNDNLGNYALRLMQGGGPGSAMPGFLGLDMTSPQNSNNPFYKWAMSRMGPDVESQIALKGLSGAGGQSTNDLMGMDRSILQQAAGGSMNGADTAGLKNMADILSRPDASGLSGIQAGLYGQLVNDPSSVGGIIESQLRNATGGFGQNYFHNLIANAANAEYNNPSQFQPGAFAKRVLPMVGIGA